MSYKLFVNSGADQNKYFVSHLLLIYFVVYAISPLSGTYTAKNVAYGICSSNATSSPGQNLNILLIEVICGKMDPKKNQGNSTGIVLIRKARAILTENIFSRFATSGNLAVFDKNTPLFENYQSRLTGSLSEHKVIGELNQLHSGPSPPSV